MDNGFDWIPFYMEFADKLLAYKNDRGSLLNILQKVYNDAGMTWPFIENDGSTYSDICPFTVFAAFNKIGTKRDKIVYYLAENFDIDASVPSEFEGIPKLDSRGAYFFEYKDGRGKNDINNLWKLFENGINFADKQDDDSRNHFIVSYNNVIAQKRVKWKATIGLYWIRPYFYVGFDAKVINYISKNNHIFKIPKVIHNKIIKSKSTVLNGNDFISVCENIKRILNESDQKFHTIPELSAYSFTYNDNNSSINYDNLNNDDIEPNNNDNYIIDASEVDNQSDVNYWVFSPGENACKWDEFYNENIMAINWSQIFDLTTYSSIDQIKEALKTSYDTEKKPINDSKCLWQFSREMKFGDIVFAKNGVNRLIGKGTVTSDYRYEPFRKSYKHVRSVLWEKCDYIFTDNFPKKTLTNITSCQEYLASILDLFNKKKGGSNYISSKSISERLYYKYIKKNFLDDVYISENDYDTLVDLLEEKYNVILQGPPGVGKSFCAKRLAYSIMGEKENNKVETVQFHQSYSYEDFIQGYRPKNGSFVLDNGVFYDFCKRAEKDLEHRYFFIIDEINRGNISKIFGELLMLIEKDHRGENVKLLYSKESFSVPNNIRIIGMMNTADRSLAMIDYALRRRFAFFDMVPAFSNEKFKEYIDDKNSTKADKLISTVESLNKKIGEDENLGDGFRIGHSYFCIEDEFTDSRLRSIVEYELIPLIKEYWFDEPSKVKEWQERLREAIK